MRKRKENRANYPKLVFCIAILALIIFAVVKIFGIMKNNNKVLKEENNILENTLVASILQTNEKIQNTIEENKRERESKAMPLANG